MRLVLQYSPKLQVLAGSLGYELLTGERFEEVVVVSEAQISDAEQRRLRELAEAVGAGLRVEVLGDDLRAWASLELPDGVVLDITPGRKIYALFLLQKCLKATDCRARYLLVRDEARYGYRFFGYMPRWAFKFIEFHPELREVGVDVGRAREAYKHLRPPQPLRVVPETLHALVNLYSLSGAEYFEVEACGGFARFRFAEAELTLENYHEAGRGDVEAFREAVSSLLVLESHERVRERIERCFAEGGVVVPDTNILVHGRFFDELRRNYNQVEVVAPVWGDIVHHVVGEKLTTKSKMMTLALKRAEALNKVVPSGVREARGDKAILDALKELADTRRKVCFLTADQRLHQLANNVLRGDSILLEVPGEPEHGSPVCVEDLYNLFLNLAYWCGSLALRVGGRVYRVEAREDSLTKWPPELRLREPSDPVEVYLVDKAVRATL